MTCPSPPAFPTSRTAYPSGIASLLIGISRRCFLRSVSARFWFFFSSRRRHTRCLSDWSSDVCSSDLGRAVESDGNLTSLDGNELETANRDFRGPGTELVRDRASSARQIVAARAADLFRREIGRASCREIE